MLPTPAPPSPNHMSRREPLVAITAWRPPLNVSVEPASTVIVAARFWLSVVDELVREIEPDHVLFPDMPRNAPVESIPLNSWLFAPTISIFSATLMPPLIWTWPTRLPITVAVPVVPSAPGFVMRNAPWFTVITPFHAELFALSTSVPALAFDILNVDVVTVNGVFSVSVLPFVTSKMVLSDVSANLRDVA